MPAPISEALQTSQFGIETTEGLLVPANRLFQGGSIHLVPKPVTKPFSPVGDRYATANPVIMEHTDVTANGILMYNEIDYWLRAIFHNAPTLTTPATGINTRKRVYNGISPTAINPVDSWSVEQGYAAYSVRVPGVRLTGGTLKFGRDSDSTITAPGIARLMQIGTAQTALAINGPSAAPTGGVVAGTGGSLAAGVYQLAYTYVNATGETVTSPNAPYTTTGTTSMITTPAITLPTGITSLNWYLSTAPAGTVLSRSLTANSGTATAITAAPAAGTPPPAINGSGATAQAQSLLVPTQMNVYFDTGSWTNLGSTQFTDQFDTEFGVTGLYGPKWVSDRSQTSYSATVDLNPGTSLKIIVEANAAGWAFLTRLRALTRIFGRWEFIGPVTEAALTYLFNVDVAFETKAITVGNKNGIHTLSLDCEVMHDSTWGLAFQFLTQGLATTL